MTTLLAAALGLVLGHTLDLVFDRLYSDAPLGGAVYRCPRCRRRVRPVHLVPVIGVLWGRGRCPDCDGRLPVHAFLLAPGAAALFAAAELIIDSFGPALLAGLFATVFLALTFTDLERRLIPNRVVYPSILLAAALSWAWPETSTVQIFVGGLVGLGMASAFLVLSLPFGSGAFGWGDLKMIILIGMVVGLPSVFVALFIGTLASAPVAGALLIFRLITHRRGRQYIPFGSFLALGAQVALFWGDPIWDWYTP